MSRPPIVGVPAFTWCAFGPSSRMFCPTESRRSARTKAGPSSSDSSIAVSTAPAERKVM